MLVTSRVTATVASSLAVAVLSFLYYQRRRRAITKIDVQAALATAEASAPASDGSPIYHALLRGEAYKSEWLMLENHAPDSFESLDVRVFQRDVAKGCIDPDLLGTDQGRDWISAEVCCGPMISEWRKLRLPAYLAHLASPLALFEPEIDEAVMVPLYQDGTWTGSLVWDSAIHVSEILLRSASWHQRLQGASVVELGSGLGLPGWCAHLIGAGRVLLTDREEIAHLCEAARVWNQVSESDVAAVSFPWSDEGARTLLSHPHLRGEPPDVLLACDCIFLPIFGSSFLLLRMLVALAGPNTVILIGLERRDGDGAESFFRKAAEEGFTSTVCAQHKRVLVIEMRRTNTTQPAVR